MYPSSPIPPVTAPTGASAGTTSQPGPGAGQTGTGGGAVPAPTAQDRLLKEQKESMLEHLRQMERP